jgi:hypothetical protein
VAVAAGYLPIGYPAIAISLSGYGSRYRWRIPSIGDRAIDDRAIGYRLLTIGLSSYRAIDDRAIEDRAVELVEPAARPDRPIARSTARSVPWPDSPNHSPIGKSR